MSKLSVISLSAVLLASSAAHAQEPLKVMSYLGLGDQVTVYDADGNRLGKRKISELPPQPAVLGVAREGMLFQIAPDMWVRKENVRLNQTATISSDLTCLADATRSKTANSGGYAVRGAGARCP